MLLLNNVTSWNGTLNDTMNLSPQYPALFNPEYRKRNAALGVLGILLNLLVLPVICTHDDLSLYLKATFCCMAGGDLVSMAATLWAGFIPVNMTLSEFACTMQKLTCTIYLAGNINCMVMVAIAVERALALCRSDIVHWLGKSKVRVALVQVSVVTSGGLLTLPVLLDHQRYRERYTPLASINPLAVATEATVCVSSSLTVCVLYTYLVCVLVRRTVSHPPSSAIPCVSSSEVSDTVSFNARRSRNPGSTGFNNDINSNNNNNNNNDSNNSNNHPNVSDSYPDSSSSTSTITSTTSQQHLTISPRQMRRFRRATIHSAVLAIWFFLAYTPFGFYYLWVLVSGKDRKEESKTVRIIIISSFPLANSLVDPVLLLWRLFPFALVRDWVQVAWFHTTTHFILVGHHLRQRLTTGWRTLRRSLRRWRRNRVEDVGGNTRRRREEVRTVVVDGPSCSTRAIHVRDAPSRKKVRLKSCSNKSTFSSRSMPPISEQNESVHV